MSLKISTDSTSNIPHPQTSNDHLICVFQLASHVFLHGDTLAEVQSQTADLMVLWFTHYRKKLMELEILSLRWNMQYNIE